MRKYLFLAGFALLLLLPLSAAADSDGYYCTAPGYLAYETRGLSEAGAHLLHVVRFSRADGIVRFPPLQLDDFQVHAMRCLPGAVYIRGGTAAYVADISDPDRPTLRPYKEGLDTTPPEPLRNLGHWSEPGVVDLDSDGAWGEFQLVTAAVSRSVDGGIEHFTTSQVVRREDTPGFPRVLEYVTLFTGVFLETVD